MQILNSNDKPSISRNDNYPLWEEMEIIRDINDGTANPFAVGGGALGTPKKKKLGKLGPIMEKKEIPVETDTNKLINYVCGSNIYKTGEDIKLKPDDEYPDWLWSLNVDRIIPLEELDPNTKQYWRRLRKMALRRNNQLARLRKF